MRADQLPHAPGDLGSPVTGVIDHHNLIDDSELAQIDQHLEDRGDRAGFVAGRQAHRNAGAALGGEAFGRELGVIEGVAPMPGASAESHWAERMTAPPQIQVLHHVRAQLVAEPNVRWWHAAAACQTRIHTAPRWAASPGHDA